MECTVGTVSIMGTVVFSGVGALGRGGRPTVQMRLKVGADRAVAVEAHMVGTGVVEGKEAAHRVHGLASWPNIAEAPTVPALGVGLRGVCPLNWAGTRERSNRGSDHGDVARVD